MAPAISVRRTCLTNVPSLGLARGWAASPCVALLSTTGRGGLKVLARKVGLSQGLHKVDRVFLLPESCALCGEPGRSPCSACAGRFGPPPALPSPAGIDRLVALFSYDGEGRRLIR